MRIAICEKCTQPFHPRRVWLFWWETMCQKCQMEERLDD